MKLRRDRQRIARPAPERLPALIESLLFVAEEPQEIGTLAKSLNVPRQGVERAVEELAASVNGRGIFVQRLGDRVQLATIPDAAPYIEQFLEVEHSRLSRAALEALAIIAYRQPISRAAIESVRGVNSDHAVATLTARGLIDEVGRAPGPGRPVLFSTTVRFLEYFGLQRPEDLPPLPEPEQAEASETLEPEERPPLPEAEQAEAPATVEPEELPPPPMAEQTADSATVEPEELPPLPEAEQAEAPETVEPEDPDAPE